MWRFFSAIFLAGLMIAAPAMATFDSEPFVGRGVVRAVRSVEGDILLQWEDGFQLVLVEDDAALHDAYGEPMALRDLPPGATIEFVLRYWKGVAFLSSLRVTPRPQIAGVR